MLLQADAVGVYQHRQVFLPLFVVWKAEIHSKGAGTDVEPFSPRKDINI